MIWARFAQHPQFSALHQQIHRVVLPFVPQAKADASPLPHITLARFKPFRYAGQPDLLPVPPADSLPVTRVELWSSHQQKGGVKYKQEKVFELKKM